ncbi:MAG TPA: STAS domain-containing protein [Gammaproteobacteria bacterium]
MSALTFEPAGAGKFRLKGRLGFDTAARALEESETLFAGHPKLELDLTGVESTDSAGLALLVEWVARARRDKRKLSFRQVPEQALALAKISEVDKILPMK